MLAVKIRAMVLLRDTCLPMHPAVNLVPQVK
jgi:hypothetical protein